MDAISDCIAASNVRFMRIDGSTKAETRNKNVAAFQNDPEMRCAVLSIRACGAGLTLTAANEVIFAELDWTPSNIIQCEGRAHRIGQEREVKCYYLLLPGSSDDIMWRQLQDKQKKLGQAGLVANSEHLSQNESSNFTAGPSTSAVKKKANQTITDFFKKTSPSSSTLSESFFTCETSFETENDSSIVHSDTDYLDDSVMQAIFEAERNAAAPSAQKEQDSDMLDESVMQAILEAEKNAAAQQNPLNNKNH